MGTHLKKNKKPCNPRRENDRQQELWRSIRAQSSRDACETDPNGPAGGRRKPGPMMDRRHQSAPGIGINAVAEAVDKAVVTRTWATRWRGRQELILMIVRPL